MQILEVILVVLVVLMFLAADLMIALMALVVGASLSIAGAQMQTILSNPLASPFTLGISAAASFGAALAIVLAQSKSGVAFSPDRLVQPYGFLGVDGLFRLRPEGTAERGFEIREITRNGFRIKRPALTAFPQAGG